MNGVIFETLVPERVLTIPNKNGAKLHVQFGIRVTNLSTIPYRFMLPYVLPELLDLDGRVMQIDYARNALIPPKESDFQLAMPEESLTFFVDAKFYWYNHQLVLKGNARDGGVWGFYNFKPGLYQVRFSYENESQMRKIFWRGGGFAIYEDFWTGEASAPFVEFCLLSR